MKTVLLTGGAGFIGSHLAEKYLESNYRVIAVDNLSSGKLSNISSVQKHSEFVFIQADICNAQDLSRIFEQYRPHIVNHHAAQKSVPASVDNPVHDAEINILGLLNIMSAIKKYNIENFISISSGGALSKEIRDNEQSLESDAPQLESPYAITKYTSEQYVRLYSELYEYEYTILRYGNVYGPRQIRDGECGVIPIFLDNIRAKKDSVLFTYNDMPRGCTRDYIYISDVVHANMLASENPINNVLNISFGEEVYILDVFEEMKRCFDSDTGIRIQGPRLGDVKRSVLNSDKARRLLNWQAKVSLSHGITLLKDSLNL